jgi:hypothetical protein
MEREAVCSDDLAQTAWHLAPSSAGELRDFRTILIEALRTDSAEVA